MNYKEEIKKLIEQTPEQLWSKYTERITYKEKVVVEVEKVHEDPLLVYTQLTNYLQIPVRKAYVVKKICGLLKEELSKECSSTSCDTTNPVGSNVESGNTKEGMLEAESNYNFEITQVATVAPERVGTLVIDSDVVPLGGDLVNSDEQQDDPEDVDVNYEKLSYEQVRERYGEEVAGLFKVGENVEIFVLNNKEEQAELIDVATPIEGPPAESVTPQDECAEINDDFANSDEQCACCISECKNCELSKGDEFEMGIKYVDKEGNEEFVIDISGREGVDVSNFGDGLEWQKEVREDRVIDSSSHISSSTPTPDSSITK
jgi:hypothetical protein